jgi:hypothetical protein
MDEEWVSPEEPVPPIWLEMLTPHKDDICRVFKDGYCPMENNVQDCDELSISFLKLDKFFDLPLLSAVVGGNNKDGALSLYRDPQHLPWHRDRGYQHWKGPSLEVAATEGLHVEILEFLIEMLDRKEREPIIYNAWYAACVNGHLGDAIFLRETSKQPRIMLQLYNDVLQNSALAGHFSVVQDLWQTFSLEEGKEEAAAVFGEYNLASIAIRSYEKGHISIADFLRGKNHHLWNMCATDYKNNNIQSNVAMNTTFTLNSSSLLRSSTMVWLLSSGIQFDSYTVFYLYCNYRTMEGKDLLVWQHDMDMNVFLEAAGTTTPHRSILLLRIFVFSFPLWFNLGFVLIAMGIMRSFPKNGLFVTLAIQTILGEIERRLTCFRLNLTHDVGAWFFDTSLVWFLEAVTFVVLALYGEKLNIGPSCCVALWILGWGVVNSGWGWLMSV